MLIKIENKESCSEKDLISVYYNITGLDLVKEDTFEREIGCSGYASTGEFTPALIGDYVLCGMIVNSTSGDDDLSDNFACMNFTVLDTSSIACDIWVNITTSGDFIYQEGESIKFKTELNDKSFPFEIEYWVEDLFGNYYKKPYVSQNTNQKSWTTKIEEEDRILLIKAVVDASCNDTNLTNNYDEKMFVVVGGLEKEGEESLEEESSSIEIKKVSPAEISFGDLVNAEVEIYKNSTGKYSLSAWIEKDNKIISHKTKFHLKNKNIKYKLFLPIQLKNNCDSKIKDGKAALVVEGLGEKAEKEITVSGVDEKFCGSSSKKDSDEKKELSYQIIDLPAIIFAGEDLNVVVKLTGDSKEHDYKAWSYLYRGSKCYSCGNGKERDNNLIEFELDENEEKEIRLLVKIDEETEEGEYKLKVKLNKDGQKTNKELTESIYVKEIAKELKEIKEKTKSLCLLNSGEPNIVNEDLVSKKEGIVNKVAGIVVYESSSEKAKKLIPYLIIAVLGLLCLILGWKKI